MIEFLVTMNWAAVVQIIIIDILLGGDNAVVIALACRNLPASQRTKGIIWGTVGAIVLRVILIAFAVALLQVPFLKLVGGALLLWIGVKLVAPADEDGHGNVQGGSSLLSAIKTIIVADLVMSIDNVIAIAGAAQQADPDHQIGLVIFGLIVSIPIIVWGRPDCAEADRPLSAGRHRGCRSAWLDCGRHDGDRHRDHLANRRHFTGCVLRLRGAWRRGGDCLRGVAQAPTWRRLIVIPA